ncbi:JAB domain-containing protein, partial [Acidiphilium sp. JA12-A1]|uniref:JAB domain-containing protein n=1 Tax=Acidiphilium sp. JA12-A1 TaxID=1464546 RepID=UPI00054D1E32
YLTIAMAREPVEQFRVIVSRQPQPAARPTTVASRGTVNHTQVYVREVVRREHVAEAIAYRHRQPGRAAPARRLAAQAGD